jgi:putative FmdB family regulatory protein|tara:strand:- start:1117 stop:1479 length:363 start_codon:yes stop_codon:yes gene_type:complete
MPIYEYQCGACGHRLEKLQRLADEPLLDCPECSRTALTKLVSAAAFRLKGVGWYETDFKTGSKRNLVEDGKGEHGSSDSGSVDSPNSSDSATSSDGTGTETKPSNKGTAESSTGKSDSAN